MPAAKGTYWERFIDRIIQFEGLGTLRQDQRNLKKLWWADQRLLEKGRRKEIRVW